MITYIKIIKILSIFGLTTNQKLYKIINKFNKDGAKRNKGLTLCTDNFSLQEVVLLINIFIINFNINPSLRAYS